MHVYYNPTMYNSFFAFVVESSIQLPLSNRFGNKWKISPRYVGPYGILSCLGKVAYELELPADFVLVHPVFHVSLLNKCIGDLAIVVPLESVDVQNSLSYKKVPSRGLRSPDL